MRFVRHHGVRTTTRRKAHGAPAYTAGPAAQPTSHSTVRNVVTFPGAATPNTRHRGGDGVAAVCGLLKTSAQVDAFRRGRARSAWSPSPTIAPLRIPDDLPGERCTGRVPSTVAAWLIWSDDLCTGGGPTRFTGMTGCIRRACPPRRPVPGRARRRVRRRRGYGWPRQRGRRDGQGPRSRRRAPRARRAGRRRGP